MLAAALDVRQQPREIIKERIEDTGRHVIHRMERYLNTLGTIALIGPLLGLFGTVIGLIRMFMEVMAGGIGDPAKMAGGIGEALICTAPGLTVAIPAYVLHRYFRSRVAGYCVAMEKQATALLDELTLAPARRRRQPHRRGRAAFRRQRRPCRARGRALSTMRIGNDRREDDFEINVIPLIDVLLTLLMFFVLTSTFVQHSRLQVTLPQASAQPQPRPQRAGADDRP